MKTYAPPPPPPSPLHHPLPHKTHLFILRGNRETGLVEHFTEVKLPPEVDGKIHGALEPKIVSYPYISQITP